MTWRLFSKMGLLALFFVATMSLAPRSIAADDLDSCRVAVAAIAKGDGDFPWISTLQAGAYIDFGITSQSTATSRYANSVRIAQRDKDGNFLSTYRMTQPSSLDKLTLLVMSRPGGLWLIGNEPDTLVQDGTFPEVYAQAYHDIYNAIKATDPTAVVGNAALVSATEHRMDYLTQVWDAYQALYKAPMPVDVWNMHLYILAEVGPDGQPTSVNSGALGVDVANAKRASTGIATDCMDPFDNRYCYAEHDNMQIFEHQVLNMRQWMADRGQRNKPLILSEWSVLLPYGSGPEDCFKDEFGNCFTPERVIDFMNASVNYMQTARSTTLGYPYDDNRLIQQFYWFGTITTRAGRASNLLKENYLDYAPGSPAALSLIGERYVELATAYPLRPNLQIISVDSSNDSSKSDVTLRAQFLNGGNVAINRPFKVTFYSNSSLTQPIGTAEVARVEGCGLDRYEASVEWNSAPSGSREFWVKVDSGNSIAESKETDNVMKGTVVVLPSGKLFIPFIHR